MADGERTLVEKLESLRIEHRDLDDAIAGMEQRPYIDQLQLRRLKKRKLQLKDFIALIESRLIPDLDA
ncbi:MAG: YdcH family protein [Thiotrichales bacterium]|nr:YdcH family protein [Thiotrichales bacterium]